MDVELLVVPDCPNEAVAYDLTRAALADLGVAASVSTTGIESDEHALACGFTGSPMFLVNGQEPFAHSTGCGGRSGVPGVPDPGRAGRRAGTGAASGGVARRGPRLRTAVATRAVPRVG